VLRVGEEHWLVLDESRSAGEHDHRLQWLLADLPYAATSSAESATRGTVILETPEGPYAVVVGSWDAGDGPGTVRSDESSDAQHGSPLGVPLQPSRPLRDMSPPKQRRVGDHVVNSAGRRVFDVIRADPVSTRGWRSAYYLDREPAVSVTLEVRAAMLRLWTLLGPAGATVDVGDDEMRLEIGGTRVRVGLGRAEGGTLVTSATLSGDRADELVVGR